MHTLSQLQALLQAELEALSVPEAPADLYQPISYTLNLGGKRIRPVLVLLSCELFGGDVNKALKPAIGIELFHNFTLLHDDIMDNAPMRRNMQTVHERWNTNVAILAGDAMFTLSIQQMMQTEQSLMTDVLKLFTDTALLVCEGQQLDMDYEKHSVIKIDDYLKMIELKTAVLLACSLKTGAIIARTNSNNCNHIYDFGKNLGIAFQLQDDLLDVFGDKNKVGKQLGGDIIANKKTYLLLKALEMANIDQYDALLVLIQNKNNRIEPWEKVQKVTDLFQQLGIKELAEQEINKYYQDALNHLKSLQLDAIYKNVLIEFAGQLMKREL